MLLIKLFLAINNYGPQKTTKRDFVNKKTINELWPFATQYTLDDISLTHARINDVCSFVSKLHSFDLYVHTNVYQLYFIIYLT